MSVTRDDAELLFRSNTPMVFAIVRRGTPDESGLVAVKFPDDAFIRELEAFWRSGAERHQLRFSEAVADVGKVRYNAERLFKETHADRLARLRSELRLEDLLPDPHVEIVHTAEGISAFVRSRQFSEPTHISQRPDVLDALRDIGISFKALLPLGEYAPEVAGGMQRGFEEPRRVPASAGGSCVSLTTPEGTESLGMGAIRSSTIRADERRLIVDRLRWELALWNFDTAVDIAVQVEENHTFGALDVDPVVLDLLITMARAHTNRAEMRRPRSLENVERAKTLLERVVPSIVNDAERLAEVTALNSSLANLEIGLDAALALLEGRTDPFAIRTRVALLLNQQKFAEAMQVLEKLDPHERWCDLAVTAYALNDQMDKAQSFVRWAAGRADRSRYPQCVVRLAEAMMARALIDHAKSINVLPHEITQPERTKLEAVVEALSPVLQPIQAAGRPATGLDLAVLRVAWKANHLLQRRGSMAELMALMAQSTPIPLEVAQGVISGYMEAPPDLPERLLTEHPGDFDAGILAAVIQTNTLGRHKEALATAKGLLPLADEDDKKEELFKLFQQVWQNIDGPEVAECEAIAGPLVAHNPQLQAVFFGSVALRQGDADRAIAILDGQKAEDDPYWLQLRANALLQQRQLAEAVDFLFAAAKRTRQASLLQRTGDIAFQAGRHEVAVWCYETLAETNPDHLQAHGNLAHLYTFVLYDVEKAAIQFRALQRIEPTNPTHTFNLAVCLAQMFRPEESLEFFDGLCGLDKPLIQAVIGRAQLHHSMGRPDAAMASLEPFRIQLWSNPGFLMAYMTAAHAAGSDAKGHEALMALTQLRERGMVEPELFRMVQKDEALQMLKESSKHTQDRNGHLHVEMLRGRMPWVWAEQVSRNAIYWGWCMRTQEVGWIGDEPTNRARFCIYSTNGFHARTSNRGRRELLPLECPPTGTKVVADIAALITLHRLGLLDAVAEHFGEVLVPAGYLPMVLEDSRQMVLGQRSQQMNAEQIGKQVSAGRIRVLNEGAETVSPMPIVDEYEETTEHRYRLMDLVRPLHTAGILNEGDFALISRACAEPSAVDEAHPALARCREIAVDLTSLETVAHFGLLDALAMFYRICISTQAHREVLQRLETIAHQEATRQWHMDLWNRLRGDARFKFVPHTVPDQMREKDHGTQGYLPFLASFIAQSTKTPLLVDDRACQAFTLNEVADLPQAAFGSDVVVVALMEAGKLDSGKAAAAIRQLIRWRYRFIVPSPKILKVLADEYRTSPPGRALREVAEYVHDCLRDAGLFGGPEKTDLGESMAMRLYLSWQCAIAEFLVLVWADEAFTAESAIRLTEWSCREFLPSGPRVVGGQVKVQGAILLPRLFLSRALIKTANYYGEQRMADAMKAMKEALRLTDDEYARIVTGILHDTARTTPRL